MRVAKLDFDDADGDNWPQQDSPRQDDVAMTLPPSPLLALSPAPDAPHSLLSPVVPSPSWMGNTGFQDDHVALWQRAENQFDIKNVPPKLPKNINCDIRPSDYDNKFKPENKSKCKFLGSKKGFAYKKGEDGIGYYPDVPSQPAPIVIRVSIADFIDASSVVPDLPPAPEPDQMQVEQISTRRARRNRNPDGTRAKHQSRKQRAIANLPLQVETVIAKGSPLSHITEHSCKKQGLWSILTANTNSWDTAVTELLPYAPDDVLLLQETRIFRDRAQRTAQLTARKAGWNPTFNLAHPTLGTGGSAGCAVFTKNGIGISKAGLKTLSELVEHRVAISWVNAVAKGGVHFVSIYLIDSVGLNEANKLILQEVTAAVKSLKGPWVIAGDWNLSPEILAASGFLQMIGGALFSPADPTCNDNRYDFFVVSKALSFAVVGAQRVDGVHMKPHRPVRLLLTRRRAQVRCSEDYSTCTALMPTCHLALLLHRLPMLLFARCC